MAVTIIAELAGGHVGKIEKALQLVRIAAECGADAVKVQIYLADELCTPDHPDYKLFQSLEFEAGEWALIRDEAERLGLRLYADVFGVRSLAQAKALNVQGFKIHTADLDNWSLLEDVANSEKHVFLGVGGRKRVEIYEALKFIRRNSDAVRVVLMPGHQLFPTPISEHSLHEIAWLRDSYADMQVEVGCADHIDGDDPSAVTFPIAAIGAGATYIEKHLTLDRALKLEDYESALDPGAFASLVRAIRGIEPSLSAFPCWTSGRQTYRRKAVKSPLVRADLGKGCTLSFESVEYLRAIPAIDPLPYPQWNGRRLCADVPGGNTLTGAKVAQRVGILVNARSASTRLPRKALLPIQGVPSILLLLERMRQVRSAEQIVFCTTTRDDDDELASVAAAAGFEVFRGANENVAKRLLDAAEKYGLDHIVRVTGDDLLRDIGLIEEGIASHLEHNADYTVADNVVYSCESEIINVRALRTIVERAVVEDNTEYLSWYLDDTSAFVVNRIAGPERLKRDYRLTLDTAEDLKVFEGIFSALYKSGAPVSLDEAIAYLDANPQIAATNRAIKPKLMREELDLRMRI